MKPYAGGEYVYVRDAYGPMMGFMYAWTTLLISKPGSIASIATGMVRILGTFATFSFLGATLVRTPFVVTAGQLVAVSVVVFISFINYIGVKKAGEFQVVFTVLKVVIIVGVILVYRSSRRAAHGRTSPRAILQHVVGRLDSRSRCWQRYGRMTDGTI
jgi:APA family basic amino acid/polyamine antiporter